MLTWQGRIQDFWKGAGVHLRSTSKKGGSRRGSNFRPNVKKPTTWAKTKGGGAGPLPPLDPPMHNFIIQGQSCLELFFLGCQYHNLTNLNIWLPCILFHFNGWSPHKITGYFSRNTPLTCHIYSHYHIITYVTSCFCNNEAFCISKIGRRQRSSIANVM